MPLKKARVKRAYKPRARKVYKRKRNALAPGPNSFFPKHKAVTLKYAQTYAYIGQSTNMLAAQFKLNSLYSPEGSQSYFSRLYSNAQPYYFDQISPQYDNYCVTKCKVRVSFNTEEYAPYNLDSTRGVSFVATLRDNDDNSTVPSSMQLEMVRPGTSVKMSACGNVVTITKTFDIPKLAGITLQRYLADPANWGASASPGNPTNVYYANACMQYIAGILVNPAITVEMWQTAVFMGPTQVAMS